MVLVLHIVFSFCHLFNRSVISKLAGGLYNYVIAGEVYFSIYLFVVLFESILET